MIRLDLSNFDPLEEHIVVGKKSQTILSIISVGNVVYYHQEHVCNSFFDGVGEFVKMASFGVSEQFWCPGGPKIIPGTTKIMNFEHQRVAKSLKRVYQLIKQPYTFIYRIRINKRHTKRHVQ